MSIINPNVFRAYDIRGVVGPGFDATAVNRIGRAIGALARKTGQEKIATGRDGRLSSPDLQEALNEGLTASGLKVIDVGCVPSPVLYYAALYKADGNGVIVTGSHNPAPYNGLKIMIAGETLAGEAITAIGEDAAHRDFVDESGSVVTHPIIDQYLEQLLANIRLARPLKVVLDCGNGAASVLMPQLLQRLGCEVITLFCEVDGRFPNHHPDPSQPANLHDLITTVRKVGADIGLAFDGDGDRLGVVAPDGSIIWPDRLLMLFAAEVLAHQPGAEIIFDVKCSRHLGETITALGGVPVMWRTGHSLIKARMKESDAPLAGEFSGHIFFNDNWLGVDDACYGAARLLAIIAATDDIQSLFDGLPEAISTPELHVAINEGTAPTYIERFRAFSDRFDDARCSTIDGLRVDFSDGWALVRPSNTTPVLVLRFEAESEEALHRIQGCIGDMFRTVAPELEVPF